MATIKNYTDINQSKKLAEILPLESADMLFQLGENKYADSIRVPLTKEHWEQMIPAINPCWSLAALLGVLPDIHLKKYIYDGITKYYTTLVGIKQFNSEHYDNPIDACVAMIEKLNELNLL